MTSRAGSGETGRQTTTMDSGGSEQAPRVLVVDDEKVIREILADFLSLEGFWVRTAEDGRLALAEIDAHPYDLVISDLKMPNMGGIELLEHINKGYPNVWLSVNPTDLKF